jgi:hypothetical protein
MNFSSYLFGLCMLHINLYTRCAKGCIFLLLLASAVSAASQVSDQAGHNIHFTSDTTRILVGSMAAGSLVLMSDGREKRIEDIKQGDLVAAYDPVLEDYITTEVTGWQKHTEQSVNLANVMLILEEFSVSIQMNGGLAGVSLQVSPNYEVYTKSGPKPVSQLTEVDIVYCYDEAIHKFLPFRVYEMEINSNSSGTTYSLQTEHKNCIINSTVVLQRDEL